MKPFPELDANYGTSDAVRAAPKLTVRLTTTAAELIELQDNREDYCRAWGIELTYPAKRIVELRASAAALRDLAEEFDLRDSPEWDHDNPASARRSARRARLALLAAVR